MSDEESEGVMVGVFLTATRELQREGKARAAQRERVAKIRERLALAEAHLWPLVSEESPVKCFSAREFGSGVGRDVVVVLEGDSVIVKASTE